MTEITIAVTAAQLAALLDITPRRLRQLRDEGVVLAEGRGIYSLQASVIGYIKFLRNENIRNTRTAAAKSRA